MGNQPKDPRDKDDLVIAPGGPRSKDLVHPVGPGEAVRRSESGAHTVVPKDQPASGEGRSAMDEALVLTPGGFRPKSLVHHIEPGHVLRATAGRLQKLHPSGKMLVEFEAIPLRPGNEPLMPRNVRLAHREVPALGSGWISYASWSNNAGQPVSLFATTWVVPRPPATQSGQTIFLFNGIQNSTMIYQPVLQWGPSAAGGGNFWAVASWYADGQNGQAFYSQLVKVNPGDVLVGIMTLTGQSPSGFDYDCEFQGIANSGLSIQNVQELTWCIETLEAYGVNQCSNYPASLRTAFQQISLQTGSATPALNWAAANPITDCGQHAVVVSNSSAAGEVRIYYRSTGAWHHNDLTTASAGAPIAAGNPAGYTWSVDKTQHVVYRGTDNHIHELWFNTQWHQNDLTNASGGPPPAASDPTGYTWDVDSTQHVIYRGTDGHIHELWFKGGWHHNDLTTASGGAPLPVGNPAAYTWSVDKTQHVIYRGTDNHIHELWFSGQWHHNDLTNATGGPPPAASDPVGYTWDVDSTQHVIYRGTDGHIHELWFKGGWHHNDLTTASGAPLAVGNPAGYTWSVDKTQHVVYRGADNHIHELWFGGQWHHNDLTVASLDAPPAAGDPAGYTWSVDNTQHVVYRGPDGDVYELWYNGQWHYNDLIDATGRPTLAANHPFGYTWNVDNTQHVVYRGTDGHIHELWLHG